MLYFIYGEDTYRARKNVREIVDTLNARNSNAAIYRLNTENSTEEKIADLVSGQNLFGQKSVIVFDGLLASPKTGSAPQKISPDTTGFLVKNTEKMSGSANIYIILETKPEVKLAKKISKFAQKTLRFSKLPAAELKEWIKKEAKEREIRLGPDEVTYLSENFGQDLWAISQALELKKLGGEPDIQKFLYSPFSLPNLFAQKRKHEAYKNFYKNLAGGISEEEMFWKLWWQAKTLLEVSFFREGGLNSFQIKQKTGLHPFVIQKSVSALSFFERRELEKIWGELFLLWRDSRAGARDLAPGLERVILGLG